MPLLAGDGLLGTSWLLVLWSLVFVIRTLVFADLWLNVGSVVAIKSNSSFPEMVEFKMDAWEVENRRLQYQRFAAGDGDFVFVAAAEVIVAC